MNEDTFVNWCKKQRKRDDAIGDIAKDIASDKDFPKTESLKAMIKHLGLSQACEGAVEALKKAYAEYLQRQTMKEKV